MITAGTKCVSEALQVNTVLQELWMRDNDIDDDGITAISKALSKSRIGVLDIQGCEFTDSGAKELATGLSINQSITKLYISDNLIYEDGICAILKAAVDNGVCQEVVNDYYIYDPDSTLLKMMEILKTRREE